MSAYLYSPNDDDWDEHGALGKTLHEWARPVRRVIVLPNGKRVGLGAYVSAWRLLLQSDPSRRFAGFDHFPETAAEILRAFRFGMHDRINRHLPGIRNGSQVVGRLAT